MLRNLGHFIDESGICNPLKLDNAVAQSTDSIQSLSNPFKTPTSVAGPTSALVNEILNNALCSFNASIPI